MMAKRKAVALKYIEGTEAPVILAKGEGHQADIMLEGFGRYAWTDFCWSACT